MQNVVDITIEDYIADVRLNRPEKMNALNEDMFQSIIKATQELSQNDEIRAIVLSGNGRAFCAGLDLSNFSMDGDGVASQDIVARTHGVANKWQTVAYAWRELQVPVIAAVHGIAFGGGLQIMLGADIKYIAADTRLSVMEMKWGLVPDMAGSVLMRGNVRDDVFRELTYTNREFSGSDAVEYGFATHVSDNPHTDAMALAKTIAAKSPSAIVKAKRLINDSAHLHPNDLLLAESRYQQDIIGSKNQMEAVFSSMQKRPGNFTPYRD